MLSWAALRWAGLLGWAMPLQQFFKKKKTSADVFDQYCGTQKSVKWDISIRRKRKKSMGEKKKISNFAHIAERLWAKCQLPHMLSEIYSNLNPYAWSCGKHLGVRPPLSHLQPHQPGKGSRSVGLADGSVGFEKPWPRTSPRQPQRQVLSQSSTCGKPGRTLSG